MTAHADPSVAEDGATALYDFEGDFQTKVLALSLRDTQFGQRTEGLIDPRYFTDAAEAALVGIALDYQGKFRKAPDKALWGTLIADAVGSKKLRRDLIPVIKDKLKEVIAADISDREFVESKVSEFARNQAIEQAIIKSVELHAKRDFAAIDKLMKEAQLVGIHEDAGEYDYRDKIESRTEVRKMKGSGTYTFDGITTGYLELDKLLYHRDWGRKELSLYMAPAKGGKSTALQDAAKNAWLAGKNVLYLTLEVSAEITADRMDANLTDTLMRELVSKPFDVETKLKALSAKAGLLKIHEFPIGSLKASQLRRLIERYRARGIVFDLVVVDYADIMSPERFTDNDIANSKSIYVDLRALAQEYNYACLTATQTNREGAKATTAKATDVAEDFNRIRIADIVISINALEEEKAVGEARLFFAAVRNGEDGFTLNIQQDRSRMKFIKKILGRA